MTASQARALCSDLLLLPWDNQAIDAAITSTTASFLIASPQVTPVSGAPGTWWVGAGGMDALGGDRELARMLHAVASNWHPAARVAIADSCVAARAATWSAVARKRPYVIVPRGECARYLAQVPLTLIPMGDEMRETLLALGIRTAGGFAQLAAEDVERRWGAEGLLSWRLSHGFDLRRPVLARTAVERSVSTDLATSVSTVEPLIFLVNAALTRLVTALVSDARAAAGVAITLTLDDGRGPLPTGGIAHTVTREIRPARPLARVAPLREMCRTLLEGWLLSSPVSGIKIAITATAPASAEQGNLLDTEWRDPAAAEAALDRLRAELGSDSVVRPIEIDTHKPEGAGGWASIADVDESTTAPPTVAPTLDNAAMRLLDPPESAAVECVNNVPRIIRWRSRTFRITRAAGPERLSGDWWKDSYQRDYWRCGEQEQQGDLVLYRDRVNGEWMVQGWTD